MVSERHLTMCRKNKPIILFLMTVLAGALVFWFLQLRVEAQADVDSTEGFVTQRSPLSANSTEEEESAVVKELKKRGRILCWIMTHNTKAGNAKATAVNQTWAPKCDKHMFVSTNVTSLPSVDLNVTEGRDYLWQKTKRAFRYVYDHYGHEYDWFVKADDDTFMIVENLRFMLMSYERTAPIYFGCKFQVIVSAGYMSGGAGYVLSHEALRRFVEEGLSDPQKCQAADTGPEDVEIGRCMEKLGVIAADSRDAAGRHRMLPMAPEKHFIGPGSNDRNSVASWFKKFTSYPLYNEKNECCADYMISFHYVAGAKMHALYNLIYRVRVVGVTDEHRLLNVPNLAEKLEKLANKSNRALE